MCVCNIFVCNLILLKILKSHFMFYNSPAFLPHFLEYFALLCNEPLLRYAPHCVPSCRHCVFSSRRSRQFCRRVTCASTKGPTRPRGLEQCFTSPRALEQYPTKSGALEQYSASTGALEHSSTSARSLEQCSTSSRAFEQCRSRQFFRRNTCAGTKHPTGQRALEQSIARLPKSRRCKRNRSIMLGYIRYVKLYQQLVGNSPIDMRTYNQFFNVFLGSTQHGHSRLHGYKARNLSGAERPKYVTSRLVHRIQHIRHQSGLYFALHGDWEREHACGRKGRRNSRPPRSPEKNLSPYQRHPHST